MTKFVLEMSDKRLYGPFNTRTAADAAARKWKRQHSPNVTVRWSIHELLDPRDLP